MASPPSTGVPCITWYTISVTIGPAHIDIHASRTRQYTLWECKYFADYNWATGSIVIKALTHFLCLSLAMEFLTMITNHTHIYIYSQTYSRELTSKKIPVFIRYHSFTLYHSIGKFPNVHFRLNPCKAQQYDIVYWLKLTCRWYFEAELVLSAIATLQYA